MSHPLSIALCGAGGYGERYLEPLLTESGRRGFEIAGIIEPRPEGCTRWAELQARNIPLFTTLEEFFNRSRCDLLIISTPIHFHCQQTCLALAHGAHVLCEKPLCVTPEQIEIMSAAERYSGKSVTIGYQWSFSSAIQRLKADYLSDRFGAARRFRTLACWPRGERYYKRNRWAGRMHLDSGESILDSPVNNATAHFLHNMLYVLGRTPEESMEVKQIEAELWRAHLIENYDTAALRIQTASDVELHFLTSHATHSAENPTFIYEFENATVELDSARNEIVARLDGGQTVNYGSPDKEPFQKLWSALDTARTGKQPLCGIRAASAHTRCVHLAQQAAETIHIFPESSIRVLTEPPYSRRYVEGLQEALRRCYQDGTTLEQEWNADLVTTSV